MKALVYFLGYIFGIGIGLALFIFMAMWVLWGLVKLEKAVRQKRVEKDGG